MKYKELVKELEGFGVADPSGEAGLIIDRLFGVSRAQLLLLNERDFSSPELDGVLRERKNRTPLQYIFGEWEFMGKEFYVSPACLIPRPDTEILVERAIKESKSGWDVADLCTGSGCIGLSLLMYSDVKCVTLMDISVDALEMAGKNAKRHNLSDRCRFILGDIRKDMPKKRFDMIVSNPPYIPTRDIDALSDEVKKEPSLALDGGENGLDIIEFLIGDGLSYLNDGGVMLIEFGFDQGEIMDTLLGEKKGKGSIKDYEILYDYGKNPRVAIIYKG